MGDLGYEALKIGALLHDIGKLLERAEYTGKEELYNDSYGHEKSGLRFFKEYIDKFITSEEKEIIKEIIGKHHCKDVDQNDIYVNIVKLADWLSSGERIKYKKDKDIDVSKRYQKLCSIFEIIPIKDVDGLDIDYNSAYKYGLIPLTVVNNIFPAKNNCEGSYKTLKNKFCEDFKKIMEKYNINTFEVFYQILQKYTWCVPSATYWKKKSEYLPDVSLYDHSKTTCAIACCLYQMIENTSIDENYIKNTLRYLNTEKNKIKKIIEKYEKEIKEAKKSDDTKKIEELTEKKVDEIKEVLNNDVEYGKRELFSLIHGDISGVQDFIFKIVSKGAAKSLKGRSFYLDFLTELCARYVVKELNLSIANILFYGGGHFYILSYKVDDEKLEEFEETINEILFKKFGIDLYIAIGKVDLRPIDFLIDCMDEDAGIGIPYKWRECATATSKKKLRKFHYKKMDLFEPKGEGNEKRICNVCKKEVDVSDEDKNKKTVYLYLLDEETKACEECQSFKWITEFLKDFSNNEEKNYIEIIKYNEEKTFPAKLIEDTGKIKNIDKKIKFKEIPVLKEFFELLEDNEEYILMEYNLPNKNGELTIPYKIWSIAFPLDDNRNILDFSELAELSKNRTGTNKIGVLKMDVDNLGKIITKGLGNLATISRLSTLSSMLTLFFTGYIPYLIKTGEAETVFEENGKKARYGDNIYLVYSGGNDTLIVGAWDVVWDLAKRIREDFRKFVCNNPNITLSAGIVIVNPKFEFKKAVELADEELDRAKDNKEIIKIGVELEEKNSICIFNSPLNWNRVKYYSKEELDNQIKEALNRNLEEFDESILEGLFLNAVKELGKRRILHISQIVADKLNYVVNESDKEILSINIPYYWRIKYYLYRNFRDKEKLKDEVKFLEDYIDKNVRKMLKYYLSNDNQNSEEDIGRLTFNDLKIAAKIVELKTRR
ncbi:type III-A CRISPR-associated protein Cas10/Csm1 [Methanocaldococcus sp. 28A]